MQSDTSNDILNKNVRKRLVKLLTVLDHVNESILFVLTPARIIIGKFLHFPVY